MTTIYGIVTLTDEAKKRREDSCDHERVQKLQVTLKGRKFFKYLEVVYEGKTFYGYVPCDSTIESVKFQARRTINHRLYTVYMSCGNKDVECKSEPLTDTRHQERAKKAYYDEILMEMGLTTEGFDTKHVDKVLEAVRYVKILEGNDVLRLVRKIDELQTTNNLLDKDKQQLLVENAQLKQQIGVLDDCAKSLQERVDELVKERKSFKKLLKNAVKEAVDTLDD